jgi:hypothetical protein
MLCGLMCAVAVNAARAEEPAVPAQPPAPAVQPAQAAPEAPQVPKIVCEKPDFDFGQAEPGTTVTHDYEIKNAGTLTLEVRRVQPSCGCTVAKISSQIVKPGETATITASLSLAGRSGHQDKHILVESTDPQSPTLILNLHGDVRQDIMITPERLSPGQIRGDQAVEMDILFSNNSAAPVHVKRAIAATTNLIAELVTMEEGKRYRIHVKTVPPLPPGQVDGMIQLVTDYAARPVYEIPFNAAILGPLVVAPPQILLSGQTTDPVTRFVVIRPGTASSFKVLGVELPDQKMTTEIAQFGPSGTRIQINNIITRPDLNGKAVKIKTDAPGMTEIFVPFTVMQPATATPPVQVPAPQAAAPAAVSQPAQAPAGAPPGNK